MSLLNRGYMRRDPTPRPQPPMDYSTLAGFHDVEAIPGRVMLRLSHQFTNGNRKHTTIELHPSEVANLVVKLQAASRSAQDQQRAAGPDATRRMPK